MIVQCLAAILVCIIPLAVYAEDYHIQTNSPVHVTPAGNAFVTIFGTAPGADHVNITIRDTSYVIPVRDGGFYTSIQPPPLAGTYSVTGTWYGRTTQQVGSVWTETETTGHLIDGILSVTYDVQDAPTNGMITVLSGAHEPDCINCMHNDAQNIEAGDIILISNTDTERHQFTTDVVHAVQSTGNLDPGESVRMPFEHAGVVQYTCAYHPWLSYTIHTTGVAPAQTIQEDIVLHMPEYAGEGVRIEVEYTGRDAVAHVVIIQSGEILSAGTIPLTDGRGTYVTDTANWRVGEVIVSVSVHDKHTTGTISVRPPPGAAERSGKITGYEGSDGILINGGLARPAGIIPLDAAVEATRHICTIGDDAIFRGDLGLASRSYTEGTVWCEGVNLGVYLLESGLAITDTAQCVQARSEWLEPYCYQAFSEPEPELEPEIEEPELEPEIEKPEPVESPTMIIEVPPAEDVPAIPDTGTMAVPVDYCDHVTDQSCPCPEGWKRESGWCTPDVQEAVQDVEGMRDDAVDGISNFFRWIGDALHQLFGGVGEWLVEILVL